jgi:hypothetical protein
MQQIIQLPAVVSVDRWQAGIVGQQRALNWLGALVEVFN